MSDGKFQLPQESEELDIFKRILSRHEAKRKDITGIELITQERKEQIEKHGRTIKMDVDWNYDNQLVEAAQYLMDDDNDSYGPPIPKGWNPQIWKKILLKTRKERLVIAGALIAAEIDRLNYIEKQEKEEKSAE